MDKTLLEFGVMWSGWECDTMAWIIEDENGVRQLKTTSHGSPVIEDREFLIERIHAYQRSLYITQKALELLDEK